MPNPAGSLSLQTTNKASPCTINRGYKACPPQRLGWEWHPLLHFERFSSVSLKRLSTLGQRLSFHRELLECNIEQRCSVFLLLTCTREWLVFFFDIRGWTAFACEKNVLLLHFLSRLPLLLLAELLSPSPQVFVRFSPLISVNDPTYQTVIFYSGEKGTEIPQVMGFPHR